MEPIQGVLGLGIEVVLELPNVLAAIGQEDHLLVVLHSLALEELEQAVLRKNTIRSTLFAWNP
jgi:hypothetical protein